MYALVGRLHDDTVLAPGPTPLLSRCRRTVTALERALRLPLIKGAPGIFCSGRRCLWSAYLRAEFRGPKPLWRFGR
jgi:hypothetical protein